MLQAKDITRTVAGRQKILDKVNITLEPGKLTALIGPSGGGKTTALKALAMLELPDSGTIMIDDDIHTFPLLDHQNPKPWPKVTAVFQQLFLWPHLTLRENILLPLDNPKSAATQKQLDALIKQFNMAEFIDRYPNETSGGQKQRAAIARALILKPQYILLDEITSALDVEQAAKVLQSLETLKKEGIGVLLITHHINFAQRTADHVVFLADGKVAESGPAAFIKKPKSKRAKEFFATIAAAS